MKLALAQTNPVVGALRANTAKILEASRRAAEAGADIAVFPELAICGYPPLDLVETAGFREANEECLQQLAADTAGLGIAVVAGYCGHSRNSLQATNEVGCLHGGTVVFRQRKILLPTYDVFDEARYFQPGTAPGAWEFRGTRIGLTVCEDAWNDKQFWERSLYSRDPVEELAGSGVDLLINVSASPFHIGKRRFRHDLVRAAATRHGIPVALVNQVGGNDQLLFDGSSFAVDRSGTLQVRAESFREDLVFWDHREGPGAQPRGWPCRDSTEEVEATYDALVMGTRDYVTKCGFRQAIVGLSGGIDSSLTVVLAVEALGAENVMGVAMPGPYSSEGSLTDARHTATALGIRFDVVPIGAIHEAFLAHLAPIFAGTAPGVAEENLQARVRGTLLMALANKLDGLVLTTGNKSELSVGYCTIYGDMCGGLAVISDVPKTLAYRLAEVANRRHRDAIPESVLTKPPSAELRPDQKDSDSLPPYETLDPVLRLYVEEGLAAAEIARRLDLSPSLVGDIARMVDRNEYKRQQAAPGLRVTSKAFGMGRRFPIAQRYHR